jgi:hypothetical protein
VVTPPAPAPVQPQPQPVNPTPSATVLPGTGYNTNQYYNQYHRPYQTQPTRTIVIVRGQPTRVVKVGRAPARQEHAAPAPQQIVPPVATKFDPVPSQKKPDATKPVAANAEVKTFQTDWVDKVLVMLQSKI